MPIGVTLLALLVGLLGMGLVSDPDRLGMRTSLLLGQLALITPFVLSAAALRLGARETFAWHRPSAAGMVLSIGCGLALWIAAGGLLHVQYAIWPVPPHVLAFFESLHARLDLWPPWQGLFSLTAIAVGPALTEEIAFRGALLGALRRPLGAAAAVITSAVLFALIHIPPGGYRVPFALALGLALGALRIRTGSIVPGAIAHAALNTTTVIVTARFDTGSTDLDSASAPAGLAALILGTLAAAVLAARISRPPDHVVHSIQ